MGQDECGRLLSIKHAYYRYPSTCISLSGPAYRSSGVTRYYDWTVARSSLAPDGVPVDVMLVNGEFPGPLIEANWGDWYV